MSEMGIAHRNGFSVQTAFMMNGNKRFWDINWHFSPKIRGEFAAFF
jgi:hypothetical protein